ncbi:hypothetical protein [Streptomyces sp. DSM 41634]|uniref:hypothetical protein n=1 Tax=Streptomyces sp. DSM 41634 TaxID=3448656 RepID=UPI0040401CEE
MNQTNRGSGTFVGGNVIGNIVNLFVPSQRRRSLAQAEGRTGSGLAEDDYDDVFGPMFMSLILAAGAGRGGLSYSVHGLPLGDGPAPDWWKRWAAGFFFAGMLLASIAVFLARVAQVFELWSGRSADIAVETQVRVLAYLPAGLARTLATFASATATVAALLAALFAWGDFGASVQERANIARDTASVNAARARAATQRG